MLGVTAELLAPGQKEIFLEFQTVLATFSHIIPRKKLYGTCWKKLAAQQDSST